MTLASIATIALAVLSIVQNKTSDREIVNLGEFSASRGYFFQHGNSFDIYSSNAAEDTPKTTGARMPYIHDAYSFNGKSWIRQLHRPSPEPQNYLDFSACDVRDQISFSDVYPDLQRALSSDKIKSYAALDRSASIVLFTQSQNGDKDHPLIKVALLQTATSGSDKVIDTDAAGNGEYCGYRLVPVFRNKRHRLLFIYTFEPGATSSGDIIVVYTYLLKF